MTPTPVILAAIGSREITSEEAALLQQTAKALVHRGAWLRSGGALGADTSWAIGGMDTAPERIILALPAVRHTVLASPEWAGATCWTPPYEPEVIALAAREWELKERFATSQYWRLSSTASEEDRLSAQSEFDIHSEKTTLGKSWKWLLKDKPHVAQLMIRNAAIIAGRPTDEAPWDGFIPGSTTGPLISRRSDAVLACFSPDHRSGGGTGHGWRLAQGLGIPVFNVRNAQDLTLLKAWCTSRLPSRSARTRG